VGGWGGALHAGWRDLIWQVGASGMLRRRALRDGGDTEDLSLQGGLNLAAAPGELPLTLLGELAVGQRRRPLSGNTARHSAAMVEMGWLLNNGLNLRAKYDFSDADTAVSQDHFHRVGLGFDLHPLPNLTFTAQLRLGLAPATEGLSDDAFEGSDAILILRGWL
jgi:hypothetical protein